MKQVCKDCGEEYKIEDLDILDRCKNCISKMNDGK